MFGCGNGRPFKGKPLNPDKTVHDSATGDAGRDGYTRLSRASRETGTRYPLAEPDYRSGPRFSED